MSIDIDNSDVSWRCSTPIDSIDDDIEVKPVLEDLQCLSEIREHSIHDFSIHIHKRKEYSSTDISLLAETKVEDSVMSSNNSLRLNQKCGDSFSAVTCCSIKKWTANDVFQAINAERSFFRLSTIVIRFPDKKVNKQVVTKLHKQIRAVNFLQSPFARRCIVTLKESGCRSDLLTMLNSTRFGSGFLSADSNYEELVPAVNDVDPFTLFLDNIPPQMEQKELIRMFPNCQQITVGYTNKIYYTKRYAFIIFLTVRDARETLKRTNKNCDMLVRFRRFSGSAHLPPESEIKKCQSGTKVLQQGLPIVTDPGPPVLYTERNYNVVQNVTIKAEPVKKTNEIILDDDNDIISHVDTTNYCPRTDFEKLYENLKQSREQLRMVRQLD